MLDFGFYNMDCMEGMKEYPDGYFDLAIVDPPYGDGGVPGRTENGSDRDSTGTATIPRGGVARQTEIPPREGISHTGYGRGKVHRTGGTWAEKFGKKS